LFVNPVCGVTVNGFVAGALAAFTVASVVTGAACTLCAAARAAARGCVSLATCALPLWLFSVAADDVPALAPMMSPVVKIVTTAAAASFAVRRLVETTTPPSMDSAGRAVGLPRSLARRPCPNLGFGHTSGFVLSAA
jgi:hypothetical protein